MSLRNCLHLPTIQCACLEFWNFAKQCIGGAGREKDYSGTPVTRQWSLPIRPFGRVREVNLRFGTHILGTTTGVVALVRAS
jgi:hypothetical protein